MSPSFHVFVVFIGRGYTTIVLLSYKADIFDILPLTAASEQACLGE